MYWGKYSTKQTCSNWTYLYIWNRDKFSQQICKDLEIPKSKRVNELTDDQILKIREYIDKNFKVEGDLRREYS